MHITNYRYKKKYPIECAKPRINHPYRSHPDKLTPFTVACKAKMENNSWKPLIPRNKT